MYDEDEVESVLKCVWCGEDQEVGPHRLPNLDIVALCAGCGSIADEADEAQEEGKNRYREYRREAHQLLMAGTVVLALGVGGVFGIAWGLAILGAILAGTGLLYRILLDTT